MVKCDGAIHCYYSKEIFFIPCLYHVFRKDRRHENSKVQKWRHAPSKGNLADHAPRGLVDVKSRGKCSTWVTAPQF